jgi:L-cysteine:1D-myo-inositol 2-amino-2-deoxy-alpha-D-glucopyranoside ligase
MHTGMVRYEGRKMSKSLGNLVKVSQALQRAPAAAVRIYLVSHRYRRDWEFSWTALARAARLIERARVVLKQPGGQASSALIKEFNAALSDDLDTPRAVRALRTAIRQRDAAAVRWMLNILVGTASLT